MRFKRHSTTGLIRDLVALTTLASLPAVPAFAGGDGHGHGHGHGDEPRLVGRAVLPVDTLAEGPPSGAAIPSANGITFPLPSQPVEGFSAIIDGRRPGEFLAMPDNGYGGKANSTDFLIRAYYIRPDFKTASRGTGDVDVGQFIRFRDPNGVIGFPIVNEGTADRLLTGGDIDPESLQRGRDGDLWVGDEFGPWILHFDSKGRLLDPPFPMPGGLKSPNNPFLGGQPATQPNSRGLEAMAISSNGKFLYAVLEGPTVADATVDPLRRLIFEFSIKDEAFTGRTWQYHVENTAHLVADVAALDRHRLMLIERDGGLGVTALFRNVYEIDLRDVDAAGFVDKEVVVDLTKIPDPKLVSLPEIHAGDLGLGDPFWVMCESVEAIHPVGHDRIVIGCDNNLPNTGRNPALADDNEFIVVDVPGLG
jgi:glycerophosphoryl diester phosphodiesterase